MKRSSAGATVSSLEKCANLTRDLLSVSREELQKKARAYERKRNKERNSD